MYNSIIIYYVCLHIYLEVWKMSTLGICFKQSLASKVRNGLIMVKADRLTMHQNIMDKGDFNSSIQKKLVFFYQINMYTFSNWGWGYHLINQVSIKCIHVFKFLYRHSTLSRVYKEIQVFCKGERLYVDMIIMFKHV